MIATQDLMLWLETGQFLTCTMNRLYRLPMLVSDYTTTVLEVWPYKMDIHMGEGSSLAKMDKRWTWR